jgi:peptide/nickel transport system ATP-binding protein
MPEARTLLQMDAVSRDFDVSRPWLDRMVSRLPRQRLVAVDDFSLEVRAGETVALVGESGCGKSTVARLAVGLYPPARGSVRFDGVDLRDRSAVRAAGVRQRLQMIFQDPQASLNPRWRVADIVAEPLRAHGLAGNRRETRERVESLLSQVGLSPTDAGRFPHEFSGGQRQRISIARALSSSPAFIVCDEPTSALDVSVQAQVLNLMGDLQASLGLAYLFISHNLAVVEHVAHRVGVMYLGRLVESGPTTEVLARPAHPYTRMLLAAVPDLEVRERPAPILTGEIPSPIDRPSGCSFHPRCHLASARCREETPLPKNDGTDHSVACHAVDPRPA